MSSDLGTHASASSFGLLAPEPPPMRSKDKLTSGFFVEEASSLFIPVASLERDRMPRLRRWPVSLRGTGS
jgi:hypothetical protein